MAVEVADDVVQAVVGHHGQDGAENLVLHDRHLWLYFDQGGLNIALFRIGLPAIQQLAVFQITGQPGESLVADDTAVVFAVSRILSVKGYEVLDDFFHQRLFQRLMHKQMVGRHAGLSGVEGLAPRDTACGEIEVGAFINNAGTFPAEFEHDGGEVVGGGFHDDTANGRTAGVENHIEMLL